MVDRASNCYLVDDLEFENVQSDDEVTIKELNLEVAAAEDRGDLKAQPSSKTKIESVHFYGRDGPEQKNRPRF